MLNLDFGYRAVASTGIIGDLDWLDTDGDGTYDAGEPGISGVTLNLLNSAGQVVAVSTTDASGAYSFTGLAAGTYSVQVTDTHQALGGLTASNTPSQPVTLTCSPVCERVDTIDFGYRPSSGVYNSAVGGTLWHDTVAGTFDTTGVLNAGEAGIQGVSIELWLDDGDGVIEPERDTRLHTTVTDAGGNYRFLGLMPATYLVNITDTSAVVAGMTAVQGANPTQDNNGHVNPFKVVLPANVTDTSVDFAYKSSTAANLSISGTVYEDNGGAGTLGSLDEVSIDPRALNATVTLFRVQGGGGIPVRDHDHEQRRLLRVHRLAGRYLRGQGRYRWDPGRQDAAIG